ncbi:type II toxin-antitoxin system Phd/YefM family antitoxin [Candidatus Williamhamiltonella defendens]|uniref:type II toxin-antitoxin system Phd/YefM family antitoxin n=1 Tax=Candidatus Williamhamiltonella defendens TaxID=138072 RepID=UPI0004951C74|nr:type II toxin-antitoxin system Phd/YefM family antitoxin [Candidatus Hamiltonella defensa]
MTTLTSKEFNHEVEKAKRAACQEAVFITDRGKPTHVLLSIDEYRKMTQHSHKNIVEALSMPYLSDIPFETSRLTILTHDLSNSISIP